MPQYKAARTLVVLWSPEPQGTATSAQPAGGCKARWQQGPQADQSPAWPVQAASKMGTAGVLGASCLLGRRYSLSGPEAAEKPWHHALRPEHGLRIALQLCVSMDQGKRVAVSGVLNRQDSEGCLGAMGGAATHRPQSLELTVPSQSSSLHGFVTSLPGGPAHRTLDRTRRAAKGCSTMCFGYVDIEERNLVALHPVLTDLRVSKALMFDVIVRRPPKTGLGPPAGDPGERRPSPAECTT